MELIEAIRQRRSTAPVTDAAPDDEQLYALLAIAAHSPDHASLRPWRLVTLRASDRERLGAALVTGFGDEPGTAAAAKTASKPLRAPLLVGIIAMLTDHPKVPKWEQIAAVAAMVATLQLILFDAGWTAMWRTGPATGLPEVRDLMGVASEEMLLGWLYIGGTPQEDSQLTAQPEPCSDRADPDVSGRITALPRHAGTR
jgi:nitroreductase